MKATTDAWITFEDEEDEEEEGGDGDAMHALFEEEQDGWRRKLILNLTARIRMRFLSFSSSMKLSSAETEKS